MITDKYREEQNYFFNSLLEDVMFKDLRAQDKSGHMVDRLELFITPKCNLKCTYCYLNKYGDKLYPTKVSFDQILTNIDMILEWIRKEELRPEMLELFSGEIWDMEFGHTVLNKIYDFYKSVYRISDTISIPSNMTFLLNDWAYEEMQNLIDKFNEIGVRLSFSASLDGKPLEAQTRPFDNKTLNVERDDRFYDRVFKFCVKNRFGFHPMIAANGIEKWKETYLWYEDMITRYGADPQAFMTLEVRNNDWTKNKIESYIEYIDWLFDHKFKGKSGKEIVDKIYGPIDQKAGNYEILGLMSMYERLDCGIQNRLTIRVGDLAIVPCHRTSYEKYILGKFIVEDGKITGIEGINPELFMMVYTSNPAVSNLKCGTCIYSKLCFKQCLGAQLEATNEMFSPCDTVCDLFRAKIDHLIYLYHKYDILEYLKYSFHPGLLKIYANITELLEAKEAQNSNE